MSTDIGLPPKPNSSDERFEKTMEWLQFLIDNQINPTAALEFIVRHAHTCMDCKHSAKEIVLIEANQ